MNKSIKIVGKMPIKMIAKILPNNNSSYGKQII